MPYVSIIIPVHKCEDYLNECIDSVLAQSYPDFELILIDDGSPDNSGIICDKYAQTDHRITVVHQTNQGAAAARNCGLNIATGEYVAFADSDDIVSPSWLEHLLEFASIDTLPICNYCTDKKFLGKKIQLSFPEKSISDVCDYWLYNKIGISGYLWNALYCNQIIRKNNLQIRSNREQGDYNEDLLFALSYIAYMKHIVYVGYGDYYYRQRANSLSRSYADLYFDKFEEKYQLWKSFLDTHELQQERESLATFFLYPFLQSLINKPYAKFRHIVLSDAMQECVRLGNPANENPTIIRMIQNKKVLNLWLRYQLHSLKGRFG